MWVRLVDEVMARSDNEGKCSSLSYSMGDQCGVGNQVCCRCQGGR
jgi:hypothetical protein